MKLPGLFLFTAACALVAACNNAMLEAETADDLQVTKAEPKGPSAGEDGKAIVEYQFSDFDNLPTEFSALFKPDSVSPQHYVAYIKDIDRAYFELKSGQTAKAAKSFSIISKETLFETPNDATWAGHAESLCRLGEKSEGRKQLAEAQCSQQLLSNKLTCSSLDVRVSEPDFPAACYREYCEAEILRPDFDRPNSVRPAAEDEQRLNDYTRYLGTVASLCR